VNTPVKILYVCGYGRSGSTLLDVVLGNHPAFFGAGELASIFQEMAEAQTRLCSCGRKYIECPFWSRIVSDLLVGDGEWTAGRLDRLTRKHENLLGFGKPSADYLRIWSDLLKKIAGESGAGVIVDSSKTMRKTSRRPMLLRRAGVKLSLIHLLRDPRAVMWSISRGDNRRIEKNKNPRVFGGALRGLLSWIFFNVMAELLKWRTKAPCLRIRYEDFVADPKQELTRIGEFVGIDMTYLIASVGKGEDFEVGHGVSGNRMRRRSAVKIKEDDEWRRKMPFFMSALSILAFPLMARYGYTQRRKTGAGHIKEYESEHL
jgi:hypothetical protein